VYHCGGKASDLQAWISVCALSAYNSFPDGHLLAVLTAYFDGSGKSHDPSTRFLTLVGYAAEAVCWPSFEAAWVKALSDHHVDQLHFKDSALRENPLLIGVLLETIECSSKFGMRSVSCTVNLAEHRKVSSERPGRVCAEWCVNQLLSGVPSMSCFFDRGEEFFEEVKTPWENESEKWPELSKVKEVGLVRSRDFPGIQAADWMGWYINRALNKADYDIDLALLERRASHRAIMKPTT
jgi:hypothetical protein